MKNIVTILFIAITLLQSSGKWIVILNYTINKDYIAKNLCVNRSRPSMCCMGKCLLKKQLANDEDQQPLPNKSLHLPDTNTDLFLCNDLGLNAHPATIVSINPSFYFLKKLPQFSSFVFQPPQG